VLERGEGITDERAVNHIGVLSKSRRRHCRFEARGEAGFRRKRKWRWDDAAVSEAPPELLEAATSPEWQQRPDAAYALAEFRDLRAQSALLALLHDQADTAPMEAAARALVARRDTYGTDLLCRAIATGDDDTVDHLLFFIAVANTHVEYVMNELAEAALKSEDRVIREGASELLSYFKGTSA
jgi:HEAT repeat protein